jgi:predicted nuclease of predicted toxin-antitoxin system
VRAIADFAAQSPDEAVLAEAESHAEVLVTADKDFGELVWGRGHAFHGVVLVRAHPVGAHFDLVVRVMVEHRDALPNAFVVITPTRVRVRLRRDA